MRSSFRVAVLATMAVLVPAAGVAVASTPADSQVTPDLNVFGAKDYIRQAAQEAKAQLGYPPAARALARREALANKTGQSPRAIARSRQGMPTVQHARLLVILVEFNPNANDDFSGFARYDAATRPAASPSRPAPSSTARCTTRSRTPRREGPRQQHAVGAGLHPDYYQQAHLLDPGRHPEGAQGPRRRRRPQGPDRPQLLPGGLQGPVRPRGRASPTGSSVPHSEAWYSADTLRGRRARATRATADNPRGDNQITVDALEELAKAQPDFDWASYDVEDQQDLDQDGDLYEPNGVLDHVIVVHAGVDQSDGGGAQGTYAPWANSSVVDPGNGGYAIADTGYKVVQRHLPARERRDRRDRARVRPRPRPARPLRHRRRQRPGHGLLGHHEQRLPVRPAERHPSRRTWARGASTCSAG